MALGHLGVNALDQPNLLRLVVERGHVAEARDLRRLGRNRLLGSLDGLNDIIDRAEVGGFDDLGPAVDALAVPNVIVRVSVDDLPSKAGHGS